MNEAGIKLVDFTADYVADLVDELLDKKWNRREGGFIDVGVALDVPMAPQEPVEATCSCGSGIAVRRVMVGGQPVTLLALPLIFEQFYQAGRRPVQEVARELLEAVSIYNPIPPEVGNTYAEALLREFMVYCAEVEPAR
ncbi:MAG: hypothetical protein A2W33_06105 [Chloroflexi bacterium RBG_16_52_11]|nr:MAG: hypothetical protein A2W33_06105 [Chloroflexi bacterium RBG_16_52_11]